MVDLKYKLCCTKSCSLITHEPLLISLQDEYTLSEVTLERQALGFGFRIVGGTEEGSQVTVGHIVPGGAADEDHRVATGDEILSIDGVNVVNIFCFSETHSIRVFVFLQVNSSHHKVVSLMGEAASRGQVTMILKRRVRLAPLLSQQSNYSGLQSMRGYPYDVIVSRHEHEGFGFVIISSSNQYYGSTIGGFFSFFLQEFTILNWVEWDFIVSKST